MKRTAYFIFMIFVCVFSVSAQEDFSKEKRIVSLSEIKNSYLQNVYKVTQQYGFLKFPQSAFSDCYR